MISGVEAEELFKEAFLKRGHKVVPSSKEENMFGHFDFIINGEDRVEVKSEKALNRGEESSPIFWVEAINVRGNIGWLYGKSDWIAFLHKNEFWMVRTEKLRKYVEKTIPGASSPKSYKGYKQWYRRNGRQDSVTYILPKDIELLVEQKIKINTN